MMKLPVISSLNHDTCSWNTDVLNGIKLSLLQNQNDMKMGGWDNINALNLV